MEKAAFGLSFFLYYGVSTNPVEFPLVAPDARVYYEYSFGIANIFKILRIDFNFRGNYLDNPNARRFGITGSFGFYF